MGKKFIMRLKKIGKFQLIIPEGTTHAYFNKIIFP